MKVLMIYPEYPATFWSFRYALPFVNKKASLPPLGLLTISPLLPAGWEKRLVDMNTDKLSEQDIEWADMVFVSGMIVQKDSAQEVINRSKKLGKTVVAGGPLFTTGHRDFYNVDSFVLDEGETTIPDFLKDLSEGRPKKYYTSREKPDIAKTPEPDWSLIDRKKYVSMALQISRGCPFDCEFCDVIVMNGRVPRLKPPSRVISELEGLYLSGWRGSVFIVDDNFIGNRAKVIKILEQIIEWMEKRKSPFSFYTEASVNLAQDEELMLLMRKANFDCVFVGIETPDAESLQSCGKTQNTRMDLKESVKILQRNGLQVQAGFIVGFDTDTPGTFDNIINFIQQSGIVTAMVGLLTALPETRLYKRLEKAGRILEKPTGNNTDFSINFRPVMNTDKLISGYRMILEKIFSPDNYYSRIKTFLKEYKGHSKTIKRSVSESLGALFKAVWKLGIIGSGKKYFWELFLWTIAFRPKLLPEAVTLSIYGYHYRTVLARS
ncbi:MAG: B12-binding domain-containing radical SAM protein [Candidatus Goldiibacteriota bacterium]